MKITIILQKGTEWEIDATIVGDLAIHRSYRDKAVWTVTHYPTRLTMQQVIPEHLTKDKKRLLDWAKRVQDGLKKDWLAMSKLNREEVMATPKFSHDLRGRIRAHCLSITE